MAEQQTSATYAASCHCGATKYTVTLAPPLEQQEVGECNCSICTKNGYLLVFPERSDVAFSQGGDALGEYWFGTKTVSHLFCRACASSLGIDFKGTSRRGGDRLGINVRMLADYDYEKLNRKFYDGKNLL